MDTATTQRSLKLLEGIHRAIPCLLATSDFVGNLETSLRILGKALSLDAVFVSVLEPPIPVTGDDGGLIRTPLVLEKQAGVWRELLNRKVDCEPLQYKENLLTSPRADRPIIGEFSEFFDKIDLNWNVKSEDWVHLMPLYSNGALKGVLGFGVEAGSAKKLEFYQGFIGTFIETLANWLERYEVFKLVRSERDQLRDLVNMGEPLAVKDAELRPNWEYSISDAQLLNRKIVTTIPDHVFIIDLHDHSNLYSNRSNFLGYSLENIDDPFEFFQQLIHPDDIGPAFENFFEKLSGAADDDIIESEYRMYTKTGEVVWFNERVKVFKRDKQGAVWQYLNILQDITNRKKAQAAEEKSKERYKNFVTYSTDGIYYMNCGVPIDTRLTTDEQLKLYYDNAYIEDANPAIAQMYNLEQEGDLIGATVMELHQGEHFEINQRSFLDFIKNGYRVEHIETIETTADGNKRYFQNSAVGDIVNGKLIGIWGTQQDITAKREAEIARHESDILFRNLFEKNPLGVAISDASGKLLRCNQRFAQMLGYDLDEMHQMTFMDITHPEEIDQEWKTVGEAMEKQMSLMVMEKRYIHREGHIVWANINMSLWYNEDKSLRLAMGMIEDITEKRKIRLKLEENEAFQKAILSTLPDLKFRISKDGVYLDHYSSPNDDQDLLVPPQAFLGKNVFEVLPDYLANATLINIKKAIETKQLHSFEYMLPIRGNMFHFEIRINAINENEVIAIVRNVSERNWAQVELKNKVRELDDKNRQLKDYIDSNMQLENFAYIASHDLREPLRTMGTFAQLLEKKYADQLDSTAKTYIDFVVQGSRNLNNLIEDLLVYSRIQMQENRLEIIDLPELLQEVTSGLKESIEEQNATIQFHGIPAEVTANPNRLKQLFQNLMANAIKFKKQNVPVEVQVNCRDLGDSLEFEIKDNGIGIDEEFHEKIFLLFKKLHSRKDFQGTGLGLAICKKVVEQMRGEIWLESIPNEGSSFFFTMPKNQQRLGD
ncbi:PAS domain S-box protein [Flavilitoribacter nigricans]|uniref:histidine kinase n=1 Tax=Flavilitoribacter nigricans (strain ATCC 23147 / DSM 23189 / NBRC 102662 / NCIMB 1420 / SS-2) TaxID=1122177 RepID=A0A2D0N0P8_FLAN2|nr:PAS domain S-box protein [Flavilitoribacter nigricans]PHN01948.1 hypothetical protein CRP01_34720 [Flavilitoribacter nigricans DSM 23189 = NBRC 102662]